MEIYSFCVFSWIVIIDTNFTHNSSKKLNPTLNENFSISHEMSFKWQLLIVDRVSWMKDRIRATSPDVQKKTARDFLPQDKLNHRTRTETVYHTYVSDVCCKTPDWNIVSLVLSFCSSRKIRNNVVAVSFEKRRRQRRRRKRKRRTNGLPVFMKTVQRATTLFCTVYANYSPFPSTSSTRLLLSDVKYLRA